MTSSRRSTSSFNCNACQKTVTGTCYRVKCNCLFCEECVFSHFSKSDQCPSCGSKPLTENDFHEMVVSDATLAPDIQKTCFQTMMTMRPNASSVSFPEACKSVIRQVDAMKTTTTFLMKQMIRSTASNGHKTRENSDLKKQNQDLRQQIASLQDVHQRTVNELTVKLQNKDRANAELQQRLQDMDRKYRGGGVGVSMPHHSPHQHTPASRSGGPPLQGIIAQKQQREAQTRAAMMNGRSGLSSRMGSRMSGGGMTNDRMVGAYPNTTPIQPPSRAGGNSMYHSGGGPMRSQGNRGALQLQQNVTPVQSYPNNVLRPLTSNSTGSGNRIRNLTANSGYNFSSSSLGATGDVSGHINKRRRTPSTPSSGGGLHYSQRQNPYR